MKNVNDLVGIRNLGNTCFLNSAFQALFNVPELVEFYSQLNNFDNDPEIQMKLDGNKFSEAMHQICKEVRKSSNKAKRVKVIEVRHLREMIKFEFALSKQNDAMQFILYIFDKLQLEQTPKRTRFISRDYDYYVDAWNSYETKFPSIIDKLFTGMHQKNVKCKGCGHVNNVFENFNYLWLGLEANDLEEAYENYITDKTVYEAGNLKCKECGQRPKTVITKEIIKLPKYCIFLLNRFDYDNGMESNKLIRYPKQLKLKEKCMDKVNEFENINKSLEVISNEEDKFDTKNKVSPDTKFQAKLDNKEKSKESNELKEEYFEGGDSNCDKYLKFEESKNQLGNKEVQANEQDTKISEKESVENQIIKSLIPEEIKHNENQPVMDPDSEEFINKNIEAQKRNSIRRLKLLNFQIFWSNHLNEKIINNKKLMIQNYMPQNHKINSKSPKPHSISQPSVDTASKAMPNNRLTPISQSIVSIKSPYSEHSHANNMLSLILAPNSTIPLTIEPEQYPNTTSSLHMFHQYTVSVNEH